jgi:hypothetical protein
MEEALPYIIMLIVLFLPEGLLAVFAWTFILVLLISTVMGKGGEYVWLGT